jgi:hypothetical protein
MNRIGIICIGKTTYLLVTLIPVKLTCSSFTEAVGYLLAAYYVFRINYPEKLSNVFGFLEYVAQVKSPESVIAPSVKQIVASLFPV